ncbi:MAG: hypothetical protein II765_02245, partial [Lachnospiraceae bacterium]|nr:hypothetical protein [Lachnospiraceae bacterium]
MSGRNICRMAIYYLLGSVSILYWDSHRGYIIAAWLACMICMWWHIHSRTGYSLKFRHVNSMPKYGLHINSRKDQVGNKFSKIDQVGKKHAITNLGFLWPCGIVLIINIVCALIGAFTAYRTQAQYNTYDELLTDGMYVT